MGWLARICLGPWCVLDLHAVNEACPEGVVVPPPQQAVEEEWREGLVPSATVPPRRP